MIGVEKLKAVPRKPVFASNDYSYNEHRALIVSMSVETAHIDCRYPDIDRLLPNYEAREGSSFLAMQKCI